MAPQPFALKNDSLSGGHSLIRFHVARKGEEVNEAAVERERAAADLFSVDAQVLTETDSRKAIALRTQRRMEERIIVKGSAAILVEAGKSLQSRSARELRKCAREKGL